MISIINAIIDLVFPKQCLICNQIINSSAGFCDECIPLIKYIPENCCYNCAKEKNICTCKADRNDFDGVISVFYYLPPISQLLVGLKIKRDDKKIKLLAEILKNSVIAKYKNITFDLIVGVPTLKTKEEKESFDRIDILCDNLSKKLKIKYDKNAIKKIKQTKKQHDLKASERYYNLIDAYAADSKSVRGKCILLIDDILTTGSTLNICSTELKKNGAKSVYCATISTSLLIINKKNINNI